LQLVELSYERIDVPEGEIAHISPADRAAAIDEKRSVQRCPFFEIAIRKWLPATVG